MKLLSCFLYIPIAQLSSASFSEIERVLTSKSVAIHYRKIEIRNISLVKGKEEYNSENLFSSDCPCRIIVCFIESKNKTGSSKLNPFDFRRSWKVTVNANEEVQGQLSDREKFLEQKLLDFEKQLAFFKSCVTLVPVDETAPNTRGKGKGRKTNVTETEPNLSDTQERSFFDRFRPSFSGPSNNPETQSIASTSSHHTRRSEPAPPPYEENLSTEKTIFIKQVDLLLNGAPLDQIESRETGIR